MVKKKQKQKKYTYDELTEKYNELLKKEDVVLKFKKMDNIEERSPIYIQYSSHADVHCYLTSLGFVKAMYGRLIGADDQTITTEKRMNNGEIRYCLVNGKRLIPDNIIQAFIIRYSRNSFYWRRDLLTRDKKYIKLGNSYYNSPIKYNVEDVNGRVYYAYTDFSFSMLVKYLEVANVRIEQISFKEIEEAKVIFEFKKPKEQRKKEQTSKTEE